MSNKQKLKLDHSSWLLTKRLLREGVRPYIKRIVMSVVCMGIVAASSGVLALLMKPTVDHVFLNKERALLWPLAIAVIVTSLIKGLATYLQSNLTAWVGLRIIADMQNRLFAHLMLMDLKFFTDNASGRLISRFTTDINVMRNAVSNAVTGLGRDSASVVCLVAVMFYQDWVLALISFFVFPAAIQPIVRLGKRLRRVSTNTQVSMGTFVTVLNQSLQGMRVVKAYGMEKHEQSRFGEATEQMFRLVFKSNRVRALSSPIMETLGSLAIAVIIVYDGLRVINDQTTPGAFFSFMAALLMAYQPMKNLANLNGILQEGLAGAERLFALLDLEPSIGEAPDARPLAVQGGAVRLEEVSFGYNEHHRVLERLTLDFPAGKRVALVGASGGGKSTILNLIPRFYDVEGGRVLIDGQDVRGVTLASLRGQIALVSQEILLFDDTIRANILYGRPGASDAEVVEAARHAAAHDFIMALPQGYDTMVGEHGVKLSGGQRQRVAIARAMLRNAPILLLDEATSALDAESERHVQGALDVLMEGRTTIIIAHRLSTVVDADIIHVIDHGRLAESGRHAELLARGGLYARLYAVQAAEEDEPADPDTRVPVHQLG